MILIKDRHRNSAADIKPLINIGGNMILIKDRHISVVYAACYNNIGKYDTYKGSTHSSIMLNGFVGIFGKYDTYKGSTLE